MRSLRRAHLSVALLVPSLVLLGACGGGGDGADDGTGDPTTMVDDEASATGADDGADCATRAAELTPADAAESFPDNPDAVWSVAQTGELDGLPWAEAVPEGDDVGYPAFRFVFSCETGDPVHLGTYALDGDIWTLLFTTDELGETVLPPQL